MTQEEKSLLLKDLCARLPYGVKFLRSSWNFEWDQEMSVIKTLEDIDSKGYVNYTQVYLVEDIKPYLRPMSSMTKEEIEDRNQIVTTVYNGSVIDDAFVNVIQYIDWLNAHHFDVRHLIEKGLAIDCTELNIY